MKTWNLVLLALAGSRTVSAQGPGLVVKVDMAALDPTYSQGLHLAWGLAVGLRANAHSNVLLDFSRQNLSEENGGGSSVWQTFLGAAWEYGFGAAELEHRQVMVGLRGGVLMRQSPLANAPYLGMGVGLRYPVADWLGFQARVEDVFDLPKTQTLSSCVAPGSCSPVQYGGKVEQNLGLFLGIEVHP